jgi:ATP phosphoribosyltransferase regulatory subunit
MKKYNKITPEGTRDLLFEECEALRSITSTLRETFEDRFPPPSSLNATFEDRFPPPSSLNATL